MSVLIKNIGKIYTPVSGEKYGTVLEIENCHLLIENQKISKIYIKSTNLPDVNMVIDAHGKTVLPGFVDSHTHPVFWMTREDEFIMRIQGKSYEEIAEAGGGIRNSVRRFREADKTRIKEVTKHRINRFLEYGTTTIEAKSGYGLSTADEIKSLEIIKELSSEQDLEMIPTFLGAHEIPDEYQTNRKAYIDIVIKEMIPLVAKQKLAVFCDVFCEKGVFTVDESRAILVAAKDYGLMPKIHADELSAFGGGELAAEVGAVSADHLVKVSDKGIKDMAEQGVIPILLPGTTFFLRKDEYAPARKMIDAGCEPAVATDFNPGSSATQNIQLMWTIGALKMGLLPNELLWATTVTAAKAIGMDEKIGSVEEGKFADLILLDIPNLNYLPYHYGINHTYMTIKRGKIVYHRGSN
ncbi:MAG: imidazolonepropionase [Calditrichaceae bacterium]